MFEGYKEVKPQNAGAEQYRTNTKRALSETVQLSDQNKYTKSPQNMLSKKRKRRKHASKATSIGASHCELGQARRSDG